MNDWIICDQIILNKNNQIIKFGNFFFQRKMGNFLGNIPRKTKKNSNFFFVLNQFVIDNDDDDDDDITTIRIMIMHESSQKKIFFCTLKMINQSINQ